MREHAEIRGEEASHFTPPNARHCRSWGISQSELETVHVEKARDSLNHSNMHSRQGRFLDFFDLV